MIFAPKAIPSETGFSFKEFLFTCYLRALYTSRSRLVVLIILTASAFNCEKDGLPIVLIRH